MALKMARSTLDERLLELHENRINYVRYLDHFASKSASLFSNGFFDCNGMVLISRDAIALSHYDLSWRNPAVYVPMVLSELKEISFAQDVKAVIMGGAKNHFNQLKNVLSRANIPVVAEYCDRWGRKCREAKSLTIDAKNKQVILKADMRPAFVLYEFSGDYNV